jgi:hypothetical protein
MPFTDALCAGAECTWRARACTSLPRRRCGRARRAHQTATPRFDGEEMRHARAGAQGRAREPAPVVAQALSLTLDTGKTRGQAAEGG